MRSLKFFGFLLLLAFGLSTAAVHAEKDYYLNNNEVYRNVVGSRVMFFNFDQYGSASSQEKEANGITPEGQRVLNFVTALYTDIKETMNTKDFIREFDQYMVDSQVLGQLEYTATAIVGHYNGYQNWEQYPEDLRITDPEALTSLQNAIDEIQVEDNTGDWSWFDFSSLKKAGEQLLKINADVNSLPVNDPIYKRLAAVLTSDEEQIQVGGWDKFKAFIQPISDWLFSVSNADIADDSVVVRYSSGTANEEPVITVLPSKYGACRRRYHRMLLQVCRETGSDTADGGGLVDKVPDDININKADISTGSGIMETVGDIGTGGGIMETAGGTGDMMITVVGGVEAAGGSSEAAP